MLKREHGRRIVEGDNQILDGPGNLTAGLLR